MHIHMQNKTCRQPSNQEKEYLRILKASEQNTEYNCANSFCLYDIRFKIPPLSQQPEGTYKVLFKKFNTSCYSDV
jgi:hypothetical protein